MAKKTATIHTRNNLLQRIFQTHNINSNIMTQVSVSPFVKRTPSRTFLDDFFSNINEVIGSDVVNHRPSVNVIESKDAYTLSLAAPGLVKEDFDLNVEKNLLTISAEKEMETTEDEKFTRREFGFNKFTHSFRLPKTVEIENIAATYENGVLNVTLPKKEEAKEQPPRKIKIA